MAGRHFMFAVALITCSVTQGLSNEVHQIAPPPADERNPAIITPGKSLFSGKLASPLPQDKFKDAPASWFDTHLGFRGKLLYAFDTVHRDSIEVPDLGGNFLMLRKFLPASKDHGDRDSKSSSNSESDALCYPVKIPAGYLYEPRFSPNGKYITFEVGNPDSSSGAYQLNLWNLETQNVKALHEALHYRLTFWSLDSSYIAYVEGAVQPPLTGGWVPAKLHIYNVRTGQDHLVTANEPLLNSIAWTPNNSLLYTELPPLPDTKPHSEDRDNKKDDRDPKKEPINRDGIGHLAAWRPNIYEAPATGGESKL